MNQNKKPKKRNIKKINKVMILTGIDDIFEIEKLLEKERRKKKIKKNKSTRIKKKQQKLNKKKIKNQPIISTQEQQKPQVSIDSSIILPFIKLLLDKNLITAEELQSLTLNKDNPLKQVDFKVEDNILTKTQLRNYWVYLMRHNELYCALCGHPITDKTYQGPWRLTADHTIPRSRGGITDSSNLLPAHSICNSIKTDISPEEWEKVGKDLLESYGIHVDLKHVKYNYLAKEKTK